MSKEWWQIEVGDPEALPGKNLVKLLELIEKSITVKFIVVDGVAGAVCEKLTEKLTEIFELSEFKQLAELSVQFEFGTFYLFSEKNRAQKLIQQITSMQSPDTTFFNKTVIKAVTTIKAFDNMSFIVYTNRENLAPLIKKIYPEAKIKSKNLQQLEFYE